MTRTSLRGWVPSAYVTALGAGTAIAVVADADPVLWFGLGATAGASLSGSV